MRDGKFSRKGQEPTDFEAVLLAENENYEDLWVCIGHRIGIQSLFEILDELGSMIVSVPTRENFVHRLYLPQRDAEMLRLHQDEKLTDVEIGARYGISPTAVRYARQRVLRTLAGGR